MLFDLNLKLNIITHSIIMTYFNRSGVGDDKSSVNRSDKASSGSKFNNSNENVKEAVDKADRNEKENKFETKNNNELKRYVYVVF